MTHTEIAAELASERKFVTPVSPHQMGIDAASQGMYLDSCPFPEGSAERRQFIAGYMAVTNEVADGYTEAYLDDIGYSESTQPYYW